LDGSKGVTLTGVDDSARLDGNDLVKLSFELPNPRTQVTFWVDLEHGGIPVQTRVVEEAKDQRTLVVSEEHLRDLRRVASGWLPFRMVHVSGRTSRTEGSGASLPGGALSGLFVRETVVDEANFESRPAATTFALEFPEEVSVIDSDRLLAYGRRRVWTLRDFSPAARAKGRRISLASPFPTQPPAMPLDSRSWWPAGLAIVGLACVLSAGALLLYKWRRHAT